MPPRAGKIMLFREIQMYFSQRTSGDTSSPDASISCCLGCTGRGRSIAVDEAQRAFNTGAGR